MARTLRYLLIVLNALLMGASFAQTGPGGVGNNSNNVLWLSADHGAYSNAGTNPALHNQNVQQWNDRSGNGRNATQGTVAQRPNYITGAINGYPAMRYTASTNDRMQSTGLSTGNRASVWVVARHSSLPSSNPGLIQGADVGNAYSNTPANKNMGMWVSSATSQVWGRGIQADGTTRNVTMATALASNVPYVINTMYRPSSIDQYVNHGVAGSITANGTLRSWTDMSIGCQAGTESWNGDIAEAIVYNEEVNAAQRILIANYLAAKYGISLSENDVYREDQPARGNYDHDVAGIGRVNGANVHNDAQGSGILRVNNPTDLGNNEFMMWGHDNAMLGAWGVGDLPSGIEGRLERTWRVSERNTTGTASVDVGAVDITFDLTGLGNVDPSHLRLIVDADQDGVFSNETALAGAEHVGGDSYRFSGVTALEDGVRFTLGTTNIDFTPLPIELVTFQAQLLGNRNVELKWATATEWNNDFFTVERSADLDTWIAIATVAAVGHSNALVEYTTSDAAPLQGVNYYRLRQTDEDGTSTTSSIEVVEIKGNPARDLRVFPNPTNGVLYISTSCQEAGPMEVSVLDDKGRMVKVMFYESGTTVDLADLANGTYIVHVRCGADLIAERVMVLH